ncbi:MAG: PLP-dependent aminotransferase family protein [Firmicutes bacterium]|nr:PLP-dependent aminotransferase family protein [Bacillota bacterium]
MNSNFPNYAERMDNLNASAIREILKLAAGGDIISFAGGLPSPESFPLDDINKAIAEVMKNEGPQALQYCSTEGHPGLREKLIKRMAEHNGIKGQTLENVILVNGSQQGLDLAGKIFLNKGDVVFVEEPTYLAAINAFKAYQATVIGVPTDDDGIIPEELEKMLKQYPNAKLLYVIPDFQNPTGKTMTYERRKGLIEVVNKYPIMVLEDNPYGELRYTGKMVPSIKTLDTMEKVVYMCTFSKVLAPGFRLGWMTGKKEVITKIAVAKQATDLQSGTFAQHVCNKYLEMFDLDAHIAEVLEIYGHRRAVMLEALEKEMPEGVTWVVPEGGLFLWLKLPEGLDAGEALKECIKNHVAYVPGAPFFASEKTAQVNTARFNFSFVDDDTLRKGVKACADTFRKILNK